MKARTAFVAVMLIILIPALSFADSVESKRLFNQGQYAMGIIAAEGSLGDYNITPEERAASYYWQGKNQIAKGDVADGIYSMTRAIKTKSSTIYTDELAKIADKYAGRSMDYYRACEQFLSVSQKASARKQLRAIYLSKVKVLVGQGDVSRAETFAQKIYRFDSSVGPALARIFSESALASNNSEQAKKSAQIALGYANGENKALGQKFLAVSKQIEKAKGPFDQRVDKFYQLAQRFDNQIPDNVVQFDFGEKKLVTIPPKGEFTPWYNMPPRKCSMEMLIRQGAQPNFIIYYSEGQQIVQRYLGEDVPKNLDQIKVKFQSVISEEQEIIIICKEHSRANQLASR